MKKTKFLFLIPCLVTASILLYCWVSLLMGDLNPTWRHYLGLILFFPIITYYFKNFKLAVIALGIYLLITSFNLAAITTTVSTSWINFGATGLRTPPVQLLSLGLFLIYFFLNMDTLIEIHLDHKESKSNKKI